MASTPLSADVLIVGAGPTGLMLATVLAKLGVDHVIVDGKAGPTRESRAIGVQARTLEIYEQLGLVDEVLADSTRADAVSPASAPRRSRRRTRGEVSTGSTRGITRRAVSTGSTRGVM